MNSASVRMISLCKTSLTIQPKRFKSEYKLMLYYNTLKAKPDFSPEEIRANYVELVKIYHPDNPETGDQNKFMRIRDSYEKIKSAPLWLKGTVGEECITHEDLIRIRTINKDQHKIANKYTIRHFSYKLYKVGSSR